MKKLWEFLGKTLTSGSGTSSKRFNGTYGYAVFVLLVIFIVLYDKIDDGILEILTIEVLKLLGYLSTALLGLGILDKFKQV